MVLAARRVQSTEWGGQLLGQEQEPGRSFSDREPFPLIEHVAGQVGDGVLLRGDSGPNEVFLPGLKTGNRLQRRPSPLWHPFDGLDKTTGSVLAGDATSPQQTTLIGLRATSCACAFHGYLLQVLAGQATPALAVSTKPRASFAEKPGAERLLKTKPGPRLGRAPVLAPSRVGNDAPAFPRTIPPSSDSGSSAAGTVTKTLVTKVVSTV